MHLRAKIPCLTFAYCLDNIVTLMNTEEYLSNSPQQAKHCHTKSPFANLDVF